MFEALRITSPINPSAPKVPVPVQVVVGRGDSQILLPSFVETDEAVIANHVQAAAAQKETFINSIRASIKILPEIKQLKKSHDAAARAAALAAVNAVVKKQLMDEMQRLGAAESFTLSAIAELIGDKIDELCVNHHVKDLLLHADNGYLAGVLLGEIAPAPAAPPVAPAQPVQPWLPGQPAKRVGF
jgi:ATP-dependent DNA ligase